MSAFSQDIVWVGYNFLPLKCPGHFWKVFCFPPNFKIKYSYTCECGVWVDISNLLIIFQDQILPKLLYFAFLYFPSSMYYFPLTFDSMSWLTTCLIFVRWQWQWQIKCVKQGVGGRTSFNRLLLSKVYFC